MLSRSSHSRIIYFSRSALDKDPDARLEQETQLVRTSRRQNEFALITSILAHDKGWFLQMLEGDRDSLNQTFARISGDSRHKDVRIVEWRESPRRELLPSLELISREAGMGDIFDKYGVEEVLQRGTPTAAHLREFMLTAQTLLLSRRGIEVLT
ncbi:MAG: BLUF domain-containing protein [Salinarimonadaceae bacterium]|nr:MAG: BLUF domain-containing protein [Salinarimonadaceae bacterium]